MAIVTTSLSVNDVATQTDKGRIFAVQIEPDRGNRKALLNFTLAVEVIQISVVGKPPHWEIADQRRADE
jgi:hypothetical protein